MKRILTSAFLLSFLASPVLAEDTNRYSLEKTADGYVRMDKQSGEMSICTEATGQLVCRLAADERTAYEATTTGLAKRLDVLEQKVARLEGSGLKLTDALPSDEEFDKTLSMMERFMRRFMGLAKEFDGDGAIPQKT